MSLVGIMIFAVVASILAGQIKGVKSGFDTYIAVASCLVILGFILSRLSAVVSVIERLQSYIGIDAGYMEILLKIVGISYITQFSADMCRECGYNAIGSQIQIFGKISVMLVSMPVVLALIETIEYMLS
ncbi:MAG: stage III sporulation protein AD [Lachnospiraceae bacterium]